MTIKMYDTMYWDRMLKKTINCDKFRLCQVCLRVDRNAECLKSWKRETQGKRLVRNQLNEIVALAEGLRGTDSHWQITEGFDNIKQIARSLLKGGKA